MDTPNKTPDTYRILLDENWELRDLHVFPHAYAQAYALVFCLDSELIPMDERRLNEAMRNYPWFGGYSYVNMYGIFERNVPPAFRPSIDSIQYASPGWLDLILRADVAIQIAKSVAALAGAGVAVAVAVRRIDQARPQINRARREHESAMRKLSVQEMKALRQLCEELAKLI